LKKYITFTRCGGSSFRQFAVIAAVVTTLLFGLLPCVSFAQTYYPGKWGDWEKRSPESVGMNAQLIEEAIAFAIENQNDGPKDLHAAITRSFSREPFFKIVGPTKKRGETSGMIIKNGYIIAEWGDTRRVDMTFSVTKSYLSTVAGLALDDGLIRDVHDAVKDYVRDGTYESEHNAKITWHHLLNQTSDWEGTLWGRPDWTDRLQGKNISEWQRRTLYEPGERMKYNDVRVNLASYSLLQVWRRPLPGILKERIMDPIGASPTWRWYGYEHSWVNIDGLNIQSVSGGGHFGGGLFICTRDHARFGLLFLRHGNWKGKQLISKKWIDMLRVPTPANPSYGYMWWLNTGKKRLPDAPENSYYASGFGGNYIWIDEEHDLVVVVRWLPKFNDFLKRVLAAIEE